MGNAQGSKGGRVSKYEEMQSGADGQSGQVAAGATPANQSGVGERSGALGSGQAQRGASSGRAASSVPSGAGGAAQAHTAAGGSPGGAGPGDRIDASGAGGAYAGAVASATAAPGSQARATAVPAGAAAPDGGDRIASRRTGLNGAAEAGQLAGRRDEKAAAAGTGDGGAAAAAVAADGAAAAMEPPAVRVAVVHGARGSAAAPAGGGTGHYEASGGSGHFNSASMTGAVIASQYTVGRKLGHGAFGHVYAGRSQALQDDLVAIKVEPRHVRPSLLHYEAKIYRALRGGPGIPLLRYAGIWHSRHVMVVDRLGPSLELLRTECGGRFTLKTSLLIADQILARLQFIQEQGFVHRDVKPDNFLIGRGATRHIVYAVDFGLAKRYVRSGQHIPIRYGRGMTGTPRYASLNNHNGIEQSRRDDLISLGYMLVYFMKGKLPWQGIPARSKREKFERIKELKEEYGHEKLCRGLPHCFRRYLDYTVSLGFDVTPNYDFMRALFFGARLREQVQINSPMDLIDDIREQRRIYRERRREAGGGSTSEEPPEECNPYGDDFFYYADATAAHANKRSVAQERKTDDREARQQRARERLAARQKAKEEEERRARGEAVGGSGEGTDTAAAAVVEEPTPVKGSGAGTGTATATATATAPTAPTAAATDTMSPEITSATAPPQLTASMAASYPLVKLKFHQPCQDGVSSSSTPPCSDAAGPTIEQYDMVLKYTVATSPVSVTQTTCTVQASQVSADGTEYSVGCDISGLDVGSNGKLGRVTLVSFTATDTSGVSHSSVSDNVYHNLEGFDLLVSPVLKVEDALSLYGVPSDTPERASRQKDASQGVVSFMGQYISGSDLSDYLTDMGVTKSGMVGVRGPNDPNNPGDEATLDVQWLVGTSPAVNTLVWSMSDPSGSASLEVLFERHAYMLGWATAAAASDCAPDVSSISYGAAESAISSTSATYLDDANSELLKLCLRGKTVLASSGDNGADGDNESSYYLADCSLSPSFPASSPWVTAVSATVVSSPALTPECSARPSSSTVQTQFGSEQDLCELAVSLKTGVFWTTGGGVSEYTAQPWFQAGAVQEYTTRTGVATNGKRVYPDVSAVGHQFRTVLGGQRNTVDGTSASSPLFAAMLSLINAHRLANGRPRLGFVNPALYSLYASTPSLFYDVQVGENTCSAYGSEYCCDKGYTAVQGFDAVTGLGSIADWDALRQALTTMGPQTSSPSPEPAPDSCFGTPPGSPSGGGSDSWVYYVAVAALVALLIAVAFYVRSLHRRSRRQGAQPRQRPAGPPLAQQQHVYIVPNGQQVYMPAVYAQPQPGAQTVYPGAQPGSYVRMG
mmetsp:Transcript_29135/g.95038  ORF Transcript_29135/g.95038 Transcript_29135/m.95038 type:complete len:1329 (+) Transcript_29135:292-4278(+)